jgi:hypothetical protein
MGFFYTFNFKAGLIPSFDEKPELFKFIVAH